ncbi:MAG: ferritin-like domain-containing protein [Verrucomicrobiota bacterium]
MEIEKWIRHFEQNQENRTEPHWNAPVNLKRDPAKQKILVKSLEQFQLGDGGGPGYLIAWNLKQYFNQYPAMKPLIDLWFAEEQEHSRLLGEAVQRFGGKPIRKHWSFTTFCLVRRLLGVRFEFNALLLTEIVSNNYYKMLRKYGDDPALRQMCDLIIRDETGHIAFHRARLAFGLDGNSRLSTRWAFTIRLLALAAGTMLWINHRAALNQFGATTFEFYLRFLDETEKFIAKTRQLQVEGPRRASSRIDTRALHTELLR